MNKLQALFLSRAGRATSAACVICGAALLYARRCRQQSDTSPGVEEISGWLNFVNTTLSSRDGVKEGNKDVLWSQWAKTTVYKSSIASRQGSTSLRELMVLTKDVNFCGDLLQQAETATSLLLLLKENIGKLEHEVECLLAEIFANLSACPEFSSIFPRRELDVCVCAWEQRKDSARLTICASKIRHNLHSNEMLSGNIYLLGEGPTEEEGTDVVFVNGINGSVFHTWRPRGDHVRSQKHLDCQTCWPRDWLSDELQSSRILGVDVKVRAWAWNPASSRLKDERPLVPRAGRLLKDLESAGVGQGGRKIVWVTHSMGGLLVKEMLRQGEATQSGLVSGTRGILFMSTPHRGSTSLRALFYFPFRLALSLESQELTMNSEQLLQLDEWFIGFCRRTGVKVMDMREEKATKVGPVYSTVLVRRNGPEAGETVSVPCDHISISKPVDKSDVIYTTVKGFVKACIEES